MIQAQRSLNDGCQASGRPGMSDIGFDRTQRDRFFRQRGLFGMGGRKKGGKGARFTFILGRMAAESGKMVTWAEAIASEKELARHVLINYAC